MGFRLTQKSVTLNDLDRRNDRRPTRAISMVASFLFLTNSRSLRSLSFSMRLIFSS